MSLPDLRDYSLRPILLDAALAHREGLVTYDAEGTVTLRAPQLERHEQPVTQVVRRERQFPAVRATFDDLNKALSRLSNSPLLEDGRTLRAAYDDELAHYETLVAEAFAAGAFEPDYGTYVFDHREGSLYLIAPERWHRLALVTSTSKLLTDPAGELSWREIRARLESSVVGFAGVSVGGSLFEAWMREARPRAAKLADPDWIELTNFNRCERMSLRHLVRSRAQRFDPKNPYETARVSKAEYLAYETHLVDPYVELWVYKDGLDRSNLARFFEGDGAAEPPIEMLSEMMDNLDFKILAREVARQRRIDVLMLSDFGNRSELLWNYFREHPTSDLAKGASDEDLMRALAATRTGDRARFFEMVDALCGPDWASGAFARWVKGEGEQPTGSVPQSGAMSMAAGAIGGKELALRALGYRRGDASPARAVYDLEHRWGEVR